MTLTGTTTSRTAPPPSAVRMVNAGIEQRSAARGASSSGEQLAAEGIRSWNTSSIIHSQTLPFTGTNAAAADAGCGAQSSATLSLFDAAILAIKALPTDVHDYRQLSDSDITRLVGYSAELRDAVGARGLLISGEVARRSGTDRGLSGLAQVNGFGSAEKMMEEVGRVSKRDASTQVHLGVILEEAADAGTIDFDSGEVLTPREPWLAAVAEALTGGRLSPDGADAIRRGLGAPNSAATVEQLTAAAQRLCLEGASLGPDALFRRAKAFRGDMDSAGVKLREQEIYLRRGIRDWALPDGGGEARIRFDTEGWAHWRELKGRLVSPKLGGVTFVDSDRRARADAILADGRTPEQLLFDDVMQLLRQGETTNPDFLLGSGASQVRITATQWDVDHHEGVGRVEGVAEPVSIETVERNCCDGITSRLLLDERLHPLNLGFDSRLYNRHQKTTMAVIWGGCAFGGCEKPPSYCEAHHVVFWKRDKGKTDIALGIPLCKFHHRLVHNNGWEIWIDETADFDLRFWSVPPKSVDPEQKRTLLVPKSGSMRDLRIAMEKEIASRQR
jgi:hypothetical protein